MTRPLRIEYSVALYHITSRGVRREATYEDDADCYSFLETLSEVVGRFNWVCHAYCYRDIAEHFEIHLATVGRVIRQQLL